MRTGKMAVDAKLMVGDRPFTPATGGKRLIRSPSSELWDIVANPDSPEYKQVVDAIAKANGMDKSVVLSELSQLERSTTRQNAVEIARVLKDFPTDVMVNGKHVQILNGDPFSAMESVTRTTPQRIAFIEQFGQGKVDALVDEYRKAGGDPVELENLLRASNGMPVDDPKFMHFKPGSPEAVGRRFFKAAYSIWKSAKLSASFIPNTLESIAKTPALAGGSRWLRAAWQLARHPVAAATEMARQGNRTTEVFNWMSKPDRKMEYVSHLVNGALGAPARFVNEFNELHAALAGRAMANDLAAGKGNAFDRIRLDVMKFTPKEIDALMSGKAEPSLYDAVASRMAEVTQGSTSKATFFTTRSAAR